MTKNIEIKTDDYKNPTLHYLIRGNVEQVVSISSKVASLVGSVNKALSAQIVIIPEKKFPFKITQVTAQDNKNIKFSLTDKGKNGYILNIENTSKIQGKYFDTIKLNTDSKYLPEIAIRVFGDISAKEGNQS